MWKEPRALYIIQLDGGPGWAESGSCRISSEDPCGCHLQEYFEIAGNNRVRFLAKIEGKKKDDGPLISAAQGSSTNLLFYCNLQQTLSAGGGACLWIG